MKFIKYFVLAIILSLHPSAEFLQASEKNETFHEIMVLEILAAGISLSTAQNPHAAAAYMALMSPLVSTGKYSFIGLLSLALINSVLPSKEQLDQDEERVDNGLPKLYVGRDEIFIINLVGLSIFNYLSYHDIVQSKSSTNTVIRVEIDSIQNKYSLNYTYRF